MTEKRFEVVMNEFDEVEYIMDKVAMEDRDFAEFIDFVEDICNENEQLKKDVELWKQVASQYSNELNVFEHCKKYKTECKDIYWSSD